jgi:PAS domain S-box-containing protein
MKMHELDTSGSGGNGQQGDELSMYKRLADTANDCMAIIGRNNVFLYANTAFLHKFDLSNQSINGKSVASILPDPSYNVLFGRYIKRCFLGDRVRFEKWALLPNGKRCYIEGQIFPSLSPNGSITAVFRDNSRCKKAEENLVTEKNNHEKLLDHIDDAVFSFDQSMVFQSFNQSAETIFGKKSISVIGHDINEVFNSQNIGLINFLKDFTDSFSFRTRQANFYITNADSVLVPIFFSISRLPIADGSNHVVCTCKDLSTMKNQQEIIKRTRRIGAFGQLAGGVAHDYNNMLGVILGYCELLRSEFASTPRALEYLAQIDVAGKQGCELTKRLLSYSVKAEKYSPRKPLKELLASSLAMLTMTLPK